MPEKGQPFSQEVLNRIFKLDPRNKTHIISRENSWLEFKESFNWGSKEKYAKSVAAFANTKGGYIIFGVSNSPRELVGMSSSGFDKLDAEKVTSFLNSAFSPEIEWESHTYEISGKRIGLIYVYEAAVKPVLCTKTVGEDLRESDIYYRYRGQSQRIKYSELRAILDAEREKERQLWMGHFERIARIGVANVGVFDTVSGEISGPGGSFLISEDILPKVKFIREGKFTETGEPTLRLVGNVKSIGGTIQPVKRVVQDKAIRTSDIILAFLEQAQVADPLEYIKQICFESSAFLPVYFFIEQTGLSVKQVIEEIEKVNSRGHGKEKLIRRLKGKEDFAVGSLISGSLAANKKVKFIDQIVKKRLPKTIPDAELKYFFEAITHLPSREFDIDYLFPVLKKIFETKFTTVPGAIAGAMRGAICSLDRSMFIDQRIGQLEEDFQGTSQGKKE